MTKIKFISGKKEDIPPKYLDELFVLRQKNTEEILKSPPPEVEYYRNRWTLGNSSDNVAIYTLAINHESRLIGYGYTSWNIKHDNLNRGYFWIYVREEERRKGIGKHLLKEVLNQFPIQITNVATEVFTDTDGILFIQKLIKERKYQEVLSEADLTKFNKDEVRKKSIFLKEKASKKGYNLVYIENLNHIFHVNLPKYIAMVEEIWNDMPKEEMTYEDEVLPLERYQEMYQRMRLEGDTIMTFAAIHKESGEPIGLTVSLINKYQTNLVRQEDTGVIRKHRGNGLGLALKYQMLNKLLHETNGKIWRTGNAGSNEHMLRINRKLKFEPITFIDVFEFDLQDLKNRVNKLGL